MTLHITEVLSDFSEIDSQFKQGVHPRFEFIVDELYTKCGEPVRVSIDKFVVRDSGAEFGGVLCRDVWYKMWFKMETPVFGVVSKSGNGTFYLEGG